MGLEIHIVGFKLQLANSAVGSHVNTHLKPTNSDSHTDINANHLS